MPCQFCRSLGCLEPGCPLCAQNPNRRCAGSFSTKYLSGDVLKAKCGASIRVQVVDSATLEPVKGKVLEDIYLQVCTLSAWPFSLLTWNMHLFIPSWWRGFWRISQLSGHRKCPFGGHTREGTETLAVRATQGSA